VTAINRQPTGWLGFLGIKNFGRNPATAADVLAPTWDLAELYLSANRTYETAAATITGIGANQTGQVPPGQTRYVWAYSYISNALAAGNICNATLTLINTATGASVPIAGTGPSTPPAVGDRLIVSLARPIVLQPAESLGIWVHSFAGANIPCAVGLCYTRLDA
jgi:hypothetical protein